MAADLPAGQAGAHMHALRAGALITILAMSALAGCSPVAGSGETAASAAAAPALDEPTALAEPSSSPALPEASTQPDGIFAPDRTVDATGAFRVATRSSSACTAEIPVDWTMQAPDRSDRADVFSPDGSMYAGYGIVAVNTSLQGFAAAYDPPMNDPSLYSDDAGTVAAAYGRIVVGSLGGASDLVVDDVFQPTPDYRLVVMTGSTHAGAIFHRAPGFPGDGYNYSYALPMYFAYATLDRWQHQGALVARVAASIRCITQFQPPDDHPIIETAPAGEAVDENGDDAGYNPQLGTEPVHDPNTGENFLVDPSVSWSENGPDGPGYYAQKGANDYQKLEPGRVD